MDLEHNSMLTQKVAATKLRPYQTALKSSETPKNTQGGMTGVLETTSSEMFQAADIWISAEEEI